MRVLYFAWLRETLGVPAEEVAPPTALRTVGDLIGWLKLQSPRHAAAFEAVNRIRCAVDQEFGALDTPIGDASEIAFFPPVTGG